MKHPVILDACTIINLLRIDEDEYLFKSIMSLDLHIAATVYKEVSKNINNNPLSDEQKESITQLLPSFLSHTSSDEEIVKNITQSYFDKLRDFPTKPTKLNGELYSSALSLYISRDTNSRVYFYTDDFPAKEQFTPYFSFQQIGVIGDSVDLLLFLYWTKSDFSEKQLKKYLQDLISEYNIPLKQLLGKIQSKRDSLSKQEMKDKKLIDNIDKILSGCTKLNSRWINEAIDFFKSNKKYTPIKKIIEQYPNVDTECELTNKIKNAFDSLSSYQIFKVA